MRRRSVRSQAPEWARSSSEHAAEPAHLAPRLEILRPARSGWDRGDEVEACSAPFRDSTGMLTQSLTNPGRLHVAIGPPLAPQLPDCAIQSERVRRLHRPFRDDSRHRSGMTAFGLLRWQNPAA